MVGLQLAHLGHHFDPQHGPDGAGHVPGQVSHGWLNFGAQTVQTKSYHLI